MAEPKTAVEKPFYDATKSVFKSMLDMEITRADDPKKAGAGSDVTVTISLTGDYSGDVVFRFPQATTLNIVKTLSGMDIPEVDDFAASMLGEMANIISGNAVSALSETDCRCDIRPPKIALGNGPEQAEGGDSVALRSGAGDLREQFRLARS
ncbi:MAG: chemotaxis protein CheX [Oscillospiraceae bacterium]|jgi:chemotaxis protein CheX|nr:chemotaxis protein CheX [Oscillospiraceae bacterium]